MSRSRRLQRRSTVAAAAAVPPALFLAALLVGSGGAWSPVATGVTAAVAILATTSLLCQLLARQAERVRVTGEAHPVSHPTPDVSLTPAEVQG